MAANEKVTRIKATDDAPKSAAATGKKVQKGSVKTTAKTAKAVISARSAKKAVKASKPRKSTAFTRMGDYFTGAWSELRQVRWPNRRATWSLTIAVIAFSVFFVLLILLLDALFKSIFDLIIT